MNYVPLLINQICIFFIIMLIGFVAVKLNLLQEEQINSITKIFANILAPCLIFTNITGGCTRDELLSSFSVLLVVVAIYCVLLPLALGMAKLLHLHGSRFRIFQLCFIFGNVGLIGIPVCVNVFGQTAMLYIAMFTIVDQLMIWSYGVALSYPALPGEEKLIINTKNLRNIVNPAFIATIISFLIVLCNITLPKSFVSAFSMLTNASTPLPFLYIGGTLALSNVREYLKYHEIGAIVIVKMIIFPIAVNLILRQIGFDEIMVGTCTVITGLSSIAISALLAKKNGSDDKLSVASIVITTLCCFVTLPLILYLSDVIARFL